MIKVGTPKEGQRTYCIGIDVGERGIGLAAFEIDDAGFPIRSLALLTHRIDGGILPGTEKSPVSRKASAGLARRIRRMRKYRKQRLHALDEKLLELGYPVVDNPATYEPWKARARLVEAQIDDPEKLKADLAIALRHIARHRGWRNPWLTWDAFRNLPTPSKHHQTNVKLSRERFSQDFPEDFTVGQLGALGAHPSIVTRPRGNSKRIKEQGAEPLFKEKVVQEDHLLEMQRFWEVQFQLPREHRNVLIRLVLHQNEPHVPQENVGKDELPGMKKFYRAPRADLTFQEFRIRAAVANLRVKHRENSHLSAEEYDAVYALLSTWHLNHTPTDTPVWADVAECLGVSPAHLVTPQLDEVIGNNPPINRTMDLLLDGVENKLPAKAKKQIRSWLDSADQDELQMFVAWLSDVTDGKDGVFQETGLDDVISGWDETALEKLAGIELENGRAAYSTESLKRLNQRMARDRCDLTQARKEEFGVDDYWKPTPPNLDERADHPTVDQNLMAVRRFLIGCVENWGLPVRVNLEHVRSAFMGATALAEYRNEQRRIRRQRDRAKEELRGLLPHEPTRQDARRHEYVQQQNSQCAYCGATIHVRGCELDHIVPRAGGGASTRANLVAVCRTCNQAKGRTPFAVWAANDPRPEVSVDEAAQRVRSWLAGRVTSSQRKINRETQLRLKQREEDQPLDERSMESTAYAARALRERIEKFLTDAAEQLNIEKPVVGVYRGSVVSAARKASGIDQMIRLRGKDIKDRGDFRHHALDAAVISLMNPAVGQLLALRENIRNTEFWENSEARTWKSFGEDRKSFQEWKLQSQRLGEVLREGIANDHIAVINPLRLGRNVGPVHKDTVRKLISKPVTDEWTMKDAKRIVDKDVYLQVKHALDGTKKPLLLPDDLIHDLQDRGFNEIPSFGAAAPSLAVRGGYAEYGSIHHARIYAWKNKKGIIELGILRVFSGEIAKMWPNPKTDILTAPVPEWSMSRRDVQPKTETALDTNAAVQVGWIAPGDEIAINPSDAEVGRDAFAEFMRTSPESSWTAAGIVMSRLMLLRPQYLSSESPTSETSDLLATILEKSARVNPGIVLPKAQIIRRNALGQRRIRSRHLPVSFSPMEEARRLLG